MTATALDIIKILDIVDTREYEEQGDRWVPIPGSGSEHDCDSCGSKHEIHATVLLRDNSHACVGVGCAKKSCLESDKKAWNRATNAVKRIKTLKRDIAAFEAVAKRNADIAASLPPTPPVTKIYDPPGKWSKRITIAFDCDGEQSYFLDDIQRLTKRHEQERIRCAQSAWRDRELRKLGYVNQYTDINRTKVQLQKAEQRLSDILEGVV